MCRFRHGGKFQKLDRETTGKTADQLLYSVFRTLRIRLESASTETVLKNTHKILSLMRMPISPQRQISKLNHETTDKIAVLL